MTEPVMAGSAAAEAAPRPAGNSPGAMLRAAREKQGLHIAALAAQIKVLPRKLDALEHDRYDELPDLTFARALAKTVCRALKIDDEPVLALLPRPGQDRLEHVAVGLNQPFRERPGRDDRTELAFLNRPAFWAPVIVLLAAAVLYLLPNDLLPTVGDDAVDEPGTVSESASAPVAGEAASAGAPVVDTVHSTPPEAVQPAAVPPVVAGAAAVAAASAGAGASAPVAATPATASLLVLRARAESWIEVREASGRVLISRSLQAGETVSLDGALPLRATIGNVAGTEVSFRGQPLDLSSWRDNVARLELQ